jgi:anaerobic magnesium-protoporphyrin IX monomethyl ester cyclase
MQKILFIVPPHLQISDFLEPNYNARVMERESGEKFGAVLTDMPLGPLSMSAYLKQEFNSGEIDIRVLDFNVELNHLKNWTWDRDSFAGYFRSILKHGIDRLTNRTWLEFTPDIIGTSILFGPSYDNVLDILQVSREIFPNALLLAGGGIATTTYTQMFDDSPELDAIGFTECEIPIVELLKAKNKLDHIENDRSWISRGKKNLPRSSFEAKYIWNLDEIPFYDYGIVNKDDYALNPALTAYAGVYDSSNNYHYMTSRGCPYRCNFCASHKVNGREMRYHSVERVECDLRLLKDKYGAKTIVIQDDNFMGQGEEGRKRALEIVNIIGKLKLIVVFQNSLTLISVKRELLEAMKNSGVTQLLLSVESGSSKSLKRMHKPLRLEDIERVAKDCRELGIYTDCNILIGNIFETEEDIEESAAFLRSGRCPADWFKIFITTPLPGSELHEQAIEAGLINEKVINLDFKKANLDRPELPAKRLEFLQYKMNLELNFIRNTNFQIGEELFENNGIESARHNYQLALQGFLSSIKAKDNHLFGHFFTSVTYRRLGDDVKAKHHENLALKASNDEFWKTWLEIFPEFSSKIDDLKKLPLK